MQFAVTLPWWGYVLAFAAALFFAWLAYARVSVELTPRQRLLLTTLRAAALLLIVIFLLRPVRFERSDNPRDNIIPILVDVSRSMRLADAGGPSRLEQAQALARDLQDKLSAEFRVQLFSFGESLVRAELPDLAASARRSDLSGALNALADRTRGERVAGIVVLSDGGDTAGEEAGSARPLGAPVFAVGLGATTGVRDREIVNLTAGEPLLADSSIDLSVSASSTGFGTTPVELRMSANGRPLEVRRVTPSADDAPVHEVFTVSPDADTATVYSVEIPPVPGELAAENNARSVLVPPKGRSRRVLVVEGAPGFEHTFLKRALMKDNGIEVDSVVRKGQNEQGRDTFFVQASASRAAALAPGYPLQRAELYAYDAIIFGNIEGEFFDQDQLTMTADFVNTRGGGLLVLGARSFERSGLVGTPLEEVLPMDLTDRRSGLARTMATPAPATNGVALTDDGAGHPATRIATSVAESRRRWAKLPALASTFAVGGPRPGAQVLAVTSSGGGLRPLLVSQRFGLGRSLVFAGEASWRWRMMLPAADTTHETIWRQLVRWLSAGAPDPITIAPPTTTLPGTTEMVGVLVRTNEFTPIADAEVILRVTPPGGEERSLSAALSDPKEGRYTAAVRFDAPGVYRLAADVRRGGQTVGRATRPALVGGADLEMSEPRLNEAVLGRIARASNGRYLSSADAGTLPELLRAARDESGATEMRDLWNTGWSLLAVIALLVAEWIVRRRVGLA